MIYLREVENLKFRIATEDDLTIINSLAVKIWNKHYPDIISQAQIDFMLNWMYSVNALKKQLSENNIFYLAFADEQVVGYLSYSKKSEGNYFLHKFYVDTDEHRKGIGSIFFDAVFSTIKDLKELRLTVNRKNYKAINFYFKKGFIIEEVADFDIGNNYFMNDFVMLKKF